MPSKSLPERPNLTQLKIQAKELCKAHRNGDHSCCTVLRAVRDFAERSDSEILAAKVPLHRAQFALAQHYGFASWDAMQRHVMSLPATPAMLPPDLQRAEGRVWLDRIQGWSFAQRGSSVHAAQATIMAALGEDISYEYLMGISSLAFRMQVHKDLCPSSPHPWCGYQCLRAVKALPWDIDFFEVQEDDALGVAELRRTVVASINRGVPVQYSGFEDSVIVGYQKEGEEWLCFSPYHDQGRTHLVNPPWPMAITIFTERKTEMPDRPKMALTALEDALRMAKTESVGDYFVGDTAWQQYMDYLARLDSTDSETVKGAMQGNAWIYECLANSRRIAALFLREIADGFAPVVGEHLDAAAKSYENMAGELFGGSKNTLHIAPYEWSLEEGRTWDNEMRRAQRLRLEKALPLERAALTQIEAALAAVRDDQAETHA